MKRNLRQLEIFCWKQQRYQGVYIWQTDTGNLCRIGKQNSGIEKTSKYYEKYYPETKV